MKLIWMSDLHFADEGFVLDHDPRERLSRAVEFVNENHFDADYCVVSGDLVERATPENYAAVSTYFTQLKMPVLPMVGNHDDRAMLRDALHLPDGTMPDFIQYAVKEEAALVTCLDTLVPGQDHGALCEARLNWLAHVLSDTRDRPAILFMHHPPRALGLPMQDQDRLRDSHALIELLSECPQVQMICAGHVHRPITGTVGGIPFATMRSVLYQAPPPVPAWTWDTFRPAQEPPALGVVTVDEWDVSVQYVEF